ncbi:helix-turn-helix domain-containing protein [Kordia sp. TARA_039_SRF]|nr:helix-turn-helix domain-containing protein [Kordia sp. TARA_039_SRF]
MEAKQIQKVLLFEASGTIHFPDDFLDYYHTHIYCHSGTLEFGFKGKVYTCAAGEFVFWYAESVISELIISNNFTATILLVEKEFLNGNLPDLGWSIDVLIHTRDNPVLYFNEKKNKHKVMTNFQLLYDKFLDTEHTFYEELLDTQMYLFTLEMWHVFASEFERNKRTLLSGTIYDKFIHLVGDYCMTEREVQFYAEKLNITPKHLNFVCKQNTGDAASVWIQRFVRDRLMILLENQNLTITEISDKMEFSSRSFFSRYVKKVLGMSPSEYRNRLH